MKTFLSDLISRIQRFSKKLDDQALLTSKHWVVIDELNSAKKVYIFRPNGQLLISQNGKVEKAKWEYLDQMSILIDKGDESYLFKHGLLDENVLALKVDGVNEYAFLVNENKSDHEIRNMGELFNFLENVYLGVFDDNPNGFPNTLKGTYRYTRSLETRQGTMKIKTNLTEGYTLGDLAFMNGQPAPVGTYSHCWSLFLSRITIVNGRITSL